MIPAKALRWVEIIKVRKGRVTVISIDDQRYVLDELTPKKKKGGNK